MKTVSLSSLCKDGEIGQYGIPAPAEPFSEEKIRYLRITDISDYGELINNDKKSVSSANLNKYILKEGDIVFARTGNSTGRSYFHESKNGKLAFAGFLIKFGIDPLKVNPKYLKYFTLSKEYKEWVKNLSNGSTRGNINAKVFAQCPITLVSRDRQDLIVKILSSIDFKIEANNNINSELETMAKTIYDYWFIQFDFPDENGKPYKSSGGEMVWNEELKKEIPKDWEDLKLNTILKFQKGIEPGSSEYLDSRLNENSIKFYRVGDIDSESTTYIDSSKRKYELAKEDDVIVTFDGSVGKLGFGIEGAYSGGLRKIYDPTGKISNSLIFFIFKDKNLINTIHKYATGSIILHASSSIEYLKIAYNEKLFLEFQKISQPIFELMVKNKRENKKLEELRDFLLPLLMNGQVTIND